MKTNIVIIGSGKIAEVVAYYFDTDSDYEICAFSCDADFLHDDHYLGKPCVALNRLVRQYPPDTYKAFVALGYQGLNALRQEKYIWAKEQGYELISYISPHSHAPSDMKYGDNCLVLESQSIQPAVTLGNNVFVFNGSLIGHHSRIGDHCWITSEASISGVVTLGEACFVGTNATIGHEVAIGANSMIGAGTLVTKSLDKESVITQMPSPRHRLNSKQFLKISQVF